MAGQCEQSPVTLVLQATDGLLVIDTHGYRIELRRVNYDREAEITATVQARHSPPPS